MRTPPTLPFSSTPHPLRPSVRWRKACGNRVRGVVGFPATRAHSGVEQVSPLPRGAAGFLLRATPPARGSARRTPFTRGLVPSSPIVSALAARISLDQCHKRRLSVAFRPTGPHFAHGGNRTRAQPVAPPRAGQGTAALSRRRACRSCRLSRTARRWGSRRPCRSFWQTCRLPGSAS